MCKSTFLPWRTVSRPHAAVKVCHACSISISRAHTVNSLLWVSFRRSWVVCEVICRRSEQISQTATRRLLRVKRWRVRCGYQLLDDICEEIMWSCEQEFLWFWLKSWWSCEEFVWLFTTRSLAKRALCTKFSKKLLLIFRKTFLEKDFIPCLFPVSHPHSATPSHSIMTR